MTEAAGRIGVRQRDEGRRPARERWIRGTGWAAVLCPAAWTVKWVAIGSGGDAGPIDEITFTAGLALLVVGSASLALRVTRGRGGLATVTALLVTAAVAVVLVGLLTTVSDAVFGVGTFAGGEGGLIALGVLSLVVGLGGVLGGRSAQ